MAILARDNYTCRYCGRHAPEVELHVDHIFPKSGGGSDGKNNLITSCKDCNLGKGANRLSKIKLTEFKYGEILRHLKSCDKIVETDSPTALKLEQQDRDCSIIETHFRKITNNQRHIASRGIQRILYLLEFLELNEVTASMDEATDALGYIDGDLWWHIFCGICHDKMLIKMKWIE